jgi:hypothetical protein
VISASEDCKRSESPPAQVLRDIGEYDCHRRLELPGFKFSPADGLIDIPRQRRAFALKSSAGEKHSCGDVAVHHSKMDAPTILKTGESDRIGRHDLLRRHSVIHHNDVFTLQYS